MEKTQLLENLNAQVAQYEQRRQFIERARAQAASGKFSPQVIERVIHDHEAKSAEITVQVAPLLPQFQTLTQRLEQEKQHIQTENLGIEEKVQEAELRAEIGEMTSEELEEAVGGLRDRLNGANTVIGKIDLDLAEINAAVKRWTDLAGTPAPARPEGKRKTAAAAPAPVIPQPAPTPVAPPPPVFVAPPPSAPPADEPDPEEEDDEVGAHMSRTDIKDDVSMVYDAGVEAARGDDDIAIETGDTGDAPADAPAADVQFGFEEDILGGDTGGASDVELDLGGGADADVGHKEAPAPEAAPAVSDAPRRALLLYQEGTAEEQIYPFTGDTLTIGRGRENDIQIKTDSKVSRYHCKLFRRGNNFYIEDAKSSNGTLVNGELITDRRLFGGEEVIVGETFFRFRIME